MKGVKPKIALFVGSDLVAHREMVPTVKYMVENDFEPVLFYPEHKPSANPNASQKTFKDYAFVERLILQDVIFPFLEGNPQIKSPFPTPSQIAARYGLEPPVAISDINDPAFYESIASDPDLIGSISMRCTQMFKADITQALKKDGRFLINVHSGLLPEFRGLYSTPRAIAELLKDPKNAAGEYGCTVHHIDPFMPVKGDMSQRYAGIDTGNIIELKSRKIDPLQSVYAANIELSHMAAHALQGTIDRIVRGESLRGYPQDNSKGHYYSYANAKQLEQWKKLNLTMFDTDEVARILTETFSDYRNNTLMESVVREAMMDYFVPQGAQTNISLAPTTTGERGNGHGNGNGGGNSNGGTHSAQDRFGRASSPVANDSLKPQTRAFKPTGTGGNVLVQK